jgi:hypothetical protein
MDRTGWSWALGCAVVALSLVGRPAALAGQVPASGGFAPDGPPDRPPVRVEAGGACVIDLVQRYTVDGALEGEFSIDYRILVAGPCGQPAGTFDEEWIAHGTFSGVALGRDATATLLYTARVSAGGFVSGTILLRGDVEGELEVRGRFADGRLSYSGELEPSGDGGGAR